MTVLTLTNRVTFQYICLVLQDDQGDPFVYLEFDGLYTQVGIVSWFPTAGCTKGYPVGFTRVTSYLSWIASNTGVRVD